MKKIFKNSLFTFILGAVIFTGIGVYAAKIIYATEVSYTSDKTAKTNVSDALTELYEKADKTIKDKNTEISNLNTEISNLNKDIDNLKKSAANEKTILEQKAVSEYQRGYNLGLASGKSTSKSFRIEVLSQWSYWIKYNDSDGTPHVYSFTDATQMAGTYTIK